MAIPKSTSYKVKDASGKVVFAGNAKDARRYLKQNGGSKAGLSMFFGF